jgi:hypothetical protein
MNINIFSDDSFPGEGVSIGLARGLVARHEGMDITGEGMGIGAVAIRTGGFTYFAENTNTKKAGHRIVKHFLINKRLLWTFMGKPSAMLTKFGDKSTSLYMSGSLFQKTIMNLKLIVFIKKILGLGICFEHVNPVATATCEYTIKNTGVSVKCSVKTIRDEPAKFYLMNEFSADFFHSAVRNKKIAAAPSGWKKIDTLKEFPWFYNPEKNIGFTVNAPEVSGNIPVDLYWGMEKADGISWAGFEYEANIKGIESKGLSMNYELVLSEQGVIV